jgi:FKBP-type peptidyl-prolyl cis-trans isomerase
MSLLGILLSISLSQPPQIVGPPPVEGERVVKAGLGVGTPGPNDLVKVHYVVWDTAKQWNVVDSSIAPGFTIFRIADMDEPWRSSVMKMRDKEVRATWIPELHEVVLTEMLQILKVDAPPADAAKPPADAQRMASGVLYKVVKAGDGKAPAAKDRVQVGFTAWMEDGRVYDTSVAKGGAGAFPLESAGKVFGPIFRSMTAGERALFWIPATMLFGNDATKPQGNLLYEIELKQVLPPVPPSAGDLQKAAAPRSIPEPPQPKLKPRVTRRPVPPPG